jgi:hypothetical protein
MGNPKVVNAKINSWKYRRNIHIGSDYVALQVTVPSCSHCSTCQSRVQEFQQTLANSPNAEYLWGYKQDGAYWVEFPVKSGQDPIMVLSQNLKINVIIGYC